MQITGSRPLARRWRSRSFPAATRTSPTSFGLAAPNWSCGGRRSDRCRRKAHDMAREYPLARRAASGVPARAAAVPALRGPVVIGSVFYVMERRRGIVVRHDEPLPLANHPGRAPAGQRSARRHARRSPRASTSPRRRSPLSASPPASSPRQVAAGPSAGIGRRLDDVPEMDALATWLLGARAAGSRRSPPSSTATSSWITSCSTRCDLGRLVAVFDWEMSALGDPLVDLGILLAYWSPTAPPLQHDALDDGHAPAGLFDARRDRRALCGAIRAATCRAIRYYETFALFKIAVVIQQIFYRYYAGQTDDPLREFRRARGVSGATSEDARRAHNKNGVKHGIHA